MVTSARSVNRLAVDDEANLEQFMAIMLQKKPSSFTQPHAQSSKDLTSLNNNVGNSKAPSSSVEVMEAITAPEAPAMLADKDMNQPSWVIDKPADRNHSDAATHHLRQWIHENAPVTHQQSNDPATLGHPVNKLLQSPQLSGLRAPPPTPETIPVPESMDILDITQIIQDQVEKYMDSKATPFTLGQSMHAPNRPSLLGKARVSSRADVEDDGYQHFTTSKQELSPDSHRVRDASFERMSFAVAQGSGDGLPTKVNSTNRESKTSTSALETTERSDIGGTVVQHQGGSTGNGWVPPHLRFLGQPQTSTSEIGKLGGELQTLRKAEVPVQGSDRHKLERMSSEDTVVPAQAHNTKSSAAEDTSVPPHLRFAAIPVSQGPPKQDLTSLKSTDLSLATTNSAQTAASYGTSLPPHLRFTKQEPMSIDTSNKQNKQPVASDILSSATSQPTPISSSSEANSQATTTWSNAQTAGPTTATSTGHALTPSSMTFGAISPTTAKASSAAIRAASEKEGFEGALFFGAWPQTGERDTPAARIRKVTLTNIPTGSTPTFIASLVFGGPVENIMVGYSSASVLFLNADDCIKYYDATSNGIVYKKEGNKEFVVFVELAKDVDVVGGRLKGMIDTGVTRCVRAIGADDEWGMDSLRKIAERKGRKLEGIEDGKNITGARSITFRFCNMEDAVQFKGMLVRDEEWEHCNIHYGPDPCASATGVHFDK